MLSAATAPTGEHQCARSDPQVVVNAGVLAGPMVGMRRYLEDLLPYLPPGGVAPLVPKLPRRRPRGVRLAWEQTVLPIHCSGRLLWSPSNGGPLAVRHQVVTVHDLAVLDHPEWTNRRSAQWQAFLLPRLLRRIRHVIAISAFTRSRVLALTDVRAKQVTVIPHGVNARFIPLPGAEIAVMRQRLGLSERPYVLALGTIEPRKNLPRVLAAWGRAQAQMPEAVLLVAGMEGSEKYFAAHGVRSLPARTRLLGPVPDELLPALYAGAVLSVYVSLYEGFGIPPLESMACGTPVLASTCPAVLEVVGDAAVAVDPYDTAAVAEGMVRLLKSASLREELAGRGQRRAGLFRWSEAAAATWQVLERYGA